MCSTFLHNVIRTVFDTSKIKNCLIFPLLHLYLPVSLMKKDIDCEWACERGNNFCFIFDAFYW